MNYPGDKTDRTHNIIAQKPYDPLNSGTLIVGLGNPIMSDDVVGMVVAAGVFEKLKGKCPEKICHQNLSYAGWRLIDLINGFQKLIVVDTIDSDDMAEGSWCIIDNNKINSFHLRNSHGLGLIESLQLARTCGYEVPTEILIIAVCAKNLHEFGTTLTPSLSSKTPEIIREIADFLNREYFNMKVQNSYLYNEETSRWRHIT